MRNLTIQRKKSFVGCLMKDQVYIRDMNAGERTIEGVPCRKLGDLKNGEAKTFQIEEGEQQIFLIVDKVSKEYCNATVTIPASQADVSLSGTHKFVLGSNPFCFDGVPMSVEQLEKQKKNGRKGKAIFVGAAVVGAVVGLFLPGGFFGADTAEPKTFVKGNFAITLTDAFEETTADGYFAAYRSDTAIVFANLEEKEIFGDITLEEYCQLLLEANNRTDLAMNKSNGVTWFEYTDTPDDQEIYYAVFCMEGEDAFCVVNFATPATNRKKFKETFSQWAETVEVGLVSAAA